MAEQPNSIIKEESPAALSRRIDELKLNSEELRVLRTHIWDIRNRTPLRARSVRKALFKLAQRIDAAMNGVGTEREVDPSAAREEELHAEFSAAKTNRGRRRAGRQIAEQNRDRELVMKQRKAATHEHAIALRKKEIYQAKKVQRIYNKLCKAAQVSACVRSGADIKERYI